MKHTLVEGLLSITGYKDQEIIVEELPMAEYEKFYRYWQIAMQSVSDENVDFTTAYCSNQVFRNSVVRCLKVAGIEDPEKFLTPRAMQQLLMVHDGGPGLLFQLHGELPKITGTPVKEPIPVSQKKRINLIWGGISRRLLSVQKTLFGAGLLAAF